MYKNTDYLLRRYAEKKEAIKQRLEDFKTAYNGSEEDIFAELAFCLFTPQSKAKLCDAAVKKLREKGLLLSGSENALGFRTRRQSTLLQQEALSITGTEFL